MEKILAPLNLGSNMILQIPTPSQKKPGSVQSRECPFILPMTNLKL